MQKQFAIPSLKPVVKRLFFFPQPRPLNFERGQRTLFSLRTLKSQALLSPRGGQKRGAKKKKKEPSTEKFRYVTQRSIDLFSRKHTRSPFYVARRQFDSTFK